MGDANDYVSSTVRSWAGVTLPPGADYRELEAHRLGYVTQERLKEALDQAEQERRERLVERDACRRALDERRVAVEERNAMSRIADNLKARLTDREADVARLTSELDAAAETIRSREVDVARLTSELEKRGAPVRDVSEAVAAGRAHDLAMAEVRARVIVELARSPLPGALLALAGALVIQTVIWAVVR